MKNFKILIIIGGVLFCFFVVVAGVGTYFVYRWWHVKRNYAEVLEQAEKNEVLKQILQYNSSQLAASDNLAANVDRSPASREVKSDVLNSIYSMKKDSDNYVYTKGTYEQGPAIDSCEIFKLFSKIHTTEMFDYYSNDESFRVFNKRVSYTENGDVWEYYLLLDTASYEYMGGKYATKYEWGDTTLIDEDEGEENSENYEASNDVLGEDEEVTENEGDGQNAPIDSIYGEDVTVEKVVEDGKVKYYVVTTMENVPCSLEGLRSLFFQNEEGGDEFVFEQWVDANTYEIQKEYLYKGDKKEENLVFTLEYETESKNVDYAEVADNFKFDLKGVEVRDVTPTTYLDTESQLEAIDKQLTENPVVILLPKSTELTLSYFNGPFVGEDSTYAYMSDRDFFPEGEEGDFLYEIYNYSWEEYESYASSITLDFIYTNEDVPFWIQMSMMILEKGIDIEEVMNFELFSDEDSDIKKEVRDIFIKIDGQDTKALEYTYEYESSYWEGTDEEGSDTTQEQKVTETLEAKFVVFEYAEKVYFIRFDMGSIEDSGVSEELEQEAYALLDFKSYDSSDSADRESVIKVLESSLLEEEYEDWGDEW